MIDYPHQRMRVFDGVNLQRGFYGKQRNIMLFVKID